ncbi:MAG TPA: hypothetical protein VI248_07400 [Kineosporiaceae bacterium]
MNRWKRVAGAAAGAAATVVALGIADVGGALSASASTPCKVSVMNVTGRASDYEYDTTMSRSGVITTSPRRYFKNGINTGLSSIKTVACKDSRTHAWTVVSQNLTEVENDLVLTVTGTKVEVAMRSGSRGYGVFVTKITPKAIQVEAVVCHSKPTGLLGTAHALLGLPWPVPFVAGVVQYIADHALPAAGKNYWCGRLDDPMTISWHLAKDGTAVLAPGHYLPNASVTWQEATNTGAYVGTTRQEVVEIRPGT